MLRTRKMLSALAAAAVLSTSAFAGVSATIYNAPVASAQTQIPSTGNLAIHKLIGAETDTPATGEVMEGVPGTPATGIGFDAYPVTGIDLTTAAGWEAAAALSVDDFFAAGEVKNENNLISTGLGAAVNGVTDDGGTATFADLPAGVYLVVEKANQSFEGQALAPSQPFLVTVPMTNQAGTDWLDTVHVYPKNQVLEGATKTVGPDPVASGEGVVNLTGSSVGELINYQIAATIPATGQNGLSAFTFTDKLPAELGAPQNVTVSIDGTELDAADFTSENWTVTDAGERHVLHVQLTQAGLAKATAGAPVVLSFDTEVLSTPSGTLDNDAWTSVTDPNLEVGEDPEAPGENPGTPSTSNARSIYGQINITKTGSDDNEDGTPDALAGATFELHRCEADGSIVGNPIQVGGATTFTTSDGTDEGTLGEVSISGIHLANLSTTADGTNNFTDLWATQGTQFCLEEIAAPDGYSLLPAPVMVNPFTYDADTIELVVADQEISNIGINAGFTLPLTGGNGFWVIVGAGVILLVMAGGYYVIARNRSESTN